MTRFKGEEVHNKDNGIKVGPDVVVSVLVSQSCDAGSSPRWYMFGR